MGVRRGDGRIRRSESGVARGEQGGREGGRKRGKGQRAGESKAQWVLPQQYMKISRNHFICDTCHPFAHSPK